MRPQRPKSGRFLSLVTPHHVGPGTPSSPQPHRGDNSNSGPDPDHPISDWNEHLAECSGWALLRSLVGTVRQNCGVPTAGFVARQSERLAGEGVGSCARYPGASIGL